MRSTTRRETPNERATMSKRTESRIREILKTGGWAELKKHPEMYAIVLKIAARRN